MQYYKPDAPHLWVGDCMPFYDGRLFHFYYLIDEGHHQALGGLGGHQWAHASSPDLVTWRHHPLALAISEAEESSICTGSIFQQGDTFYAFHAVRRPDWTQRLGVATSADGITFVKQPVPPYADPPANYDPLHYRDPCVFVEPGAQRFHMLVTAKRLDELIPALGGCLAHLRSDDLVHWQIQEPFLLPGFSDVPECPDLFEWNGWYYLLFSSMGRAYYRMARSPLGPWQRPPFDFLDGPWTRVMKTAGFHDNRRIGVAWIGTRLGESDTGRFQWGGHAVFRELVQQPDGTLAMKFPPEMVAALLAAGGASQEIWATLPVVAQSGGARLDAGCIRLEAQEGMAAFALGSLPRNAYIRVTVKRLDDAPRFGVRLRESAPFVDGVALELRAPEQRVLLHDGAMAGVAGLDGLITLEIMLKEDLIDVCVNGRTCLINRCPEQWGAGITFFCQTGTVVFEGLRVWPLV